MLLIVKSNDEPKRLWTMRPDCLLMSWLSLQCLMLWRDRRKMRTIQLTNALRTLSIVSLINCRPKRQSITTEWKNYRYGDWRLSSCLVQALLVFLLDWFSIWCSSNVIALANYRGHRQSSEPIKTRSNYM